MDSTPCLAILQLCLFRFTALSPSPQSCSTHFWGNSSSFCFPIPQANILLNVLMSPFRWHYPDNSIQITAAHQEGISVDSFKWKAKALYALYLLPCVYLPERRTIGRIPSSWKKNPVLIIRLLIFKKHYLSITNISVVVCLSALVFQLVARRMNNKPNFWQRNPNLPSQMKGNIHFFSPFRMLNTRSIQQNWKAEQRGLSAWFSSCKRHMRPLMHEKQLICSNLRRNVSLVLSQNVSSSV